MLAPAAAPTAGAHGHGHHHDHDHDDHITTTHHDHDHGHHHHHHDHDDALDVARDPRRRGRRRACCRARRRSSCCSSAIALHRIGFGFALIVAFSLGLAATITGIGLVAVLARRAFGRVSFDGPVVRALPAV